MSQYTSRSRQVTKKPKQQHPVWRGIGCALMLLVPIMSAAFAYETVNYGLENGWYIPYQFLGNPTLPSIIYNSTALATLLYRFTTWTNFYAYLTAFLLYVLFFGGFISFVYALVFSFVGTPRWGPLDEPPPKTRAKKYTR